MVVRGSPVVIRVRIVCVQVLTAVERFTDHTFVQRLPVVVLPTEEAKPRQNVIMR